MSTKEQLVEQHIREYQSRQLHIDELYERAHRAVEKKIGEPAAQSELQNYAEQRANLQQKADEIKTIDVHNWRHDTIENAGPMALWDILAQQLESFIEKHE